MISLSFLTILLLGTTVFFLISYLFHLSKQGYVFLKIDNIREKEIEELIKSEIQKSIQENQKQIQEIINKTWSSYQESLSRLSEEIKEQTSDIGNLKEYLQEKITQDLEKELNAFFSNFSRELSDKTDALFSNFSKEINEELLSLRKEIENYRQEKIKEINKKIYLLIEKVSKKVIGESLDLASHEKLINDALEKARKEIFL